MRPVTIPAGTTKGAFQLVHAPFARKIVAESNRPMVDRGTRVVSGDFNIVCVLHRRSPTRSGR